MLSKSKAQELALRRQVEEELFLLGLSIQDVASAMKLDLGAVRNDFRILNAKVSFPVPQKANTEYRQKIFQDALLRYAELFLAPVEKKTDSRNNRLEVAISNYLGMNDLQDLARGIEAAIDVQLHPDDLPEFEAHRKLLTAIFGPRFKPPVFVEYMRAVKGQKSELPNRYNIQRRFVSWAVEKSRQNFSLPLGKGAGRAIDSVLQTLTPREERVIRKRFGLGFQQQTFEEIGQSEGELSKERIRQIESKALRKLRHPSRSRNLEWFVSSEKALSCFFAEKFPAPPIPIPEKKDVPPTAELLAKSIEELELSVRTYNCLIRANILTIGELVEKTEAKLIKTKNFGRKSLNELKEILAEMGLKFSGTRDFQTPTEPSQILDAYRDGALRLEDAVKALENWANEVSGKKVRAVIDGVVKGLTSS